MRRLISILLITLLVCSLMPAFAAGDRLTMEYTIDDECSFTVTEAKAYDVFFNQSSGDSKDFIVVSFDVLNWRTEPLYIKTETDAKIVYDDDFEFEPEYLWPDPDGTYEADGSKGTIYIYDTTQRGDVLSNYDVWGQGFEKVSLKGDWGVEIFYDPIAEKFDSDHLSGHTCKSLDSSKTVLDPLVKRTYHYVFLVPDLVAEEEGARELIFNVAGEEYSFRF